MKLLASFILISVVITSCVEPYVPDEVASNPSFLVVDGFLNASENAAEVRLSRSMSLISDGSGPQMVTGAVVEVQEENGAVVRLLEQSAGFYRASVPVNFSRRYRLRINTGAGRYSSDWEEVFQTSPIENIRWNPAATNLEFLLDTSDPSGKNRFYRWTFTETWQYNTAYSSQFMWSDGQVVIRPIEEQISTCWRTEPGFRIIVGSSDQLSQNVIRNFLIHAVPRTSIKISNRYSINVSQMALSEKAYTYWNNLYRTTESLGGLFDPMPGRVIGNITNENDRNEPVIGYFNACTIESKRIFLTNSELPRGYNVYLPPQCDVDSLLFSERQFWPGEPLLIGEIYPTTGPPLPVGYTTVNDACGDCRALGGGVPVKPDFWP